MSDAVHFDLREVAAKILANEVVLATTRRLFLDDSLDNNRNLRLILGMSCVECEQRFWQ
jgi:hypothetical protein